MLNELYDKSIQLRTDSVSESKKRHDYTIEILKQDHALLLNAYSEHIENLCIRSLSKMDMDEHTKGLTIRVWNICANVKVSKISNIKPKTFFTGFWDSTAKAHNDDMWKEAGIPLMLTSLQDKLSHLKITDISDRSKSSSHVLEIVVPGKPS